MKSVWRNPLPSAKFSIIQVPIEMDFAHENSLNNGKCDCTFRWQMKKQRNLVNTTKTELLYFGCFCPHQTAQLS